MTRPLNEAVDINQHTEWKTRRFKVLDNPVSRDALLRGIFLLRSLKVQAETSVHAVAGNPFGLELALNLLPFFGSGLAERIDLDFVTVKLANVLIAFNQCRPVNLLFRVLDDISLDNHAILFCLCFRLF